MKFKLTEYTVALSVDEKNSLCIQLVDDCLLYNKKEIADKDKINEIVKILMQHKDEIVKLHNERFSSYKGGRQQTINIQYDDGATLVVIGNTPSVEMATLYSKLKNKLISIIEQ